ncbi:uncharacterized protein THITE_2124541 [Thermothielavioides terrestris NRRL 8126]|uniref:Required for respiratory growth protein 9, mitochondrial n=2 Tax=Thermothielavioides terrestris TaxID=2587410 RepID=G2RFY5_THETT|nr:uncharacterized protein THITE_2124541 [Thermothielavioides terrestris NRRL 8126]AEO71739.1 hypothetical protein THITE_2124541 [Thermothielavioides terrestris NRRL 8126]
MDCSCRTAALRIFVKSVAQVHVPVRAKTPRLAQYQAQVLYYQPGWLCKQRAASALPSAPRALHTSCVRNGAATAAQAGEGDVQNSSDHEAARVTETKPPVSEQAADRSKETKTQDAGPDPTSAASQQEKTAETGLKSSEKKAKKDKKEKKSKPKAEDEDEDANHPPPKKKEPWMIQKEALKKKFPEGWNPRKKLSPDALVGIRMLHKQFPEEYTTEVLAQKFEVSPEAIRRILKSKWNPDPDEEMDRQRRWFNRGKRVWTHWAALGKKPPRKWRAVGIVRDPSWNIPRGPTHKDKAARAEAQRRLAKGMLG